MKTYIQKDLGVSNGKTFDLMITGNGGLAVNQTKGVVEINAVYFLKDNFFYPLTDDWDVCNVFINRYKLKSTWYSDDVLMVASFEKTNPNKIKSKNFFFREISVFKGFGDTNLLNISVKNLKNDLDKVVASKTLVSEEICYSNNVDSVNEVVISSVEEGVETPLKKGTSQFEVFLNIFNQLENDSFLEQSVVLTNEQNTFIFKKLKSGNTNSFLSKIFDTTMSICPNLTKSNEYFLIGYNKSSKNICIAFKVISSNNVSNSEKYEFCEYQGEVYAILNCSIL